MPAAAGTSPGMPHAPVQARPDGQSGCRRHFWHCRDSGETPTLAQSGQGAARRWCGGVQPVTSPTMLPLLPNLWGRIVKGDVRLQEGAMKRLAVAVVLMLLACPAMAAVLLTATGGSGRTIGPSFDCNTEQTPEAQFICASPDLSRADLEFGQAYYALRQQVGPAGWQALKRENLDSQHRTEVQCGIAPSGALPPDAVALAACLRQGYVAQRSLWLARLSGAAREEASRPVEQHVALQRDLQALGFLPPTATIDGVYGAATRTAISAWQHANNQPVIGFISNADSSLLMNTGRPTTVVAAPTPAETQPSAAFRQGQADRQGWEAWTRSQTGS